VLLAAYGSLRWSELVALGVDRLSPSRDRVRVEEKVVESVASSGASRRPNAPGAG
jgi:hypothetical protein